MLRNLHILDLFHRLPFLQTQRPITMPYVANVYNVMIASPGDVQEERAVAREVIRLWNSVHAAARNIILLPLGWEYEASPDTGGHPQEIINRQILEHADLLVGIFWTRIGTPTTQFRSGTIEEIEKHIHAGKPAMLYFSNKAIKPGNLNQDQYNEVEKLKAEFRGKSCYETFDTVEDFERKFTRQLAKKLNDHLIFTGVQPPAADREDHRQSNLSEKAIQLLSLAANGDGTIIRLNVLEGLKYEVSDYSFPETDSPRETALFEAAIEQLEEAKLIRDDSGRREIFQVTSQGYALAENLGPQPDL